MYIPKYASASDLNFLKNFIQEHSFGALISDTGMNANHYPFLLTEDKHKIFLWTHVAKNNPQWQEIKDKECLAIFTGPHAYISPSFYMNELNVPTWNYTAVHAHCSAKIINDPILEKDLMKRMVTFFESRNNTNWTYNLPDEFNESLLKAVVWIRLEVLELEGKFKLSQNRDRKDYERVIQSLTGRGSEEDKALLRYMELTNPFKS